MTLKEDQPLLLYNWPLPCFW